MKTNGFSLVFSFGKYGGFYYHYKGYTARLCLGWMAITFIPEDIDLLFGKLINSKDNSSLNK
jgi:hypothetical protein